MIALGIWQLRRAQWKQALLAEYSRGVDAGGRSRSLLDGRRPCPPLSFRRA
jgi:cytochrome oxidase assembly protein ShyY1